MEIKYSIKETIKNGKYSFYSNILEKLTFFLFFVLAARSSTLNEYGSLISIFTFANILNFFLAFGFGSYLQRESAAENDTLSKDYSNIIIIKIILFIPFLLICELFSIRNQSNTIITLFVSLLVYTLNFNSTLNGLLYGKSKYRESFAAHALSRIVFIIVASITFFFAKNYFFLMMILITTGLLQSWLINEYVKKERIKITYGLFHYAVVGKILRSSLPIGMGIFFVFLYDKLDILLIQKFLNLESVAIYSVGYAFYKLPVIITSALLIPLFTEFSSEYKVAGTLDYKKLRNIGIYLLIYAFISIVIYLFLSKYIISVIYGSKYLPSSEVTNLLVFALPGLFLNNLTGVALNSIRKEKYPFYTTVMGMVINVLTNIILLPKIGIYGAVLATIFSETLVFILQAYLLVKTLKEKNPLKIQ